MRKIKLPPIESLPFRGLIVMMIVMPPLAQRDQRDKPVIAAVVAGRKAALAEDMRQRVNREGTVIKDHRADKETPNQHLRPRST